MKLPSLTDKSPKHRSGAAFAVTAAGVLAFFGGCAVLSIAGAGNWPGWALGAAGLAGAAWGWRAMVRERRAFDRAMSKGGRP